MRPWETTLLSVLASAAVRAAPAAGAPAAWSSRVWQPSDGLPDRNVIGVVQTPDRYLWIATPRHLTRFDGLQFEAFSLPELAAGAHATIRGFGSNERGELWLVTSAHTLVHLDPRGAPSVTTGLPQAWAEGVAVEHGRTVWIAYRKGLLARVQQGRVSTFPPVAAPAGNGACAFATDGRGRLWFAQAGQVGVFAGGRFEARLRLRNVGTRVAPARGGGLWVVSGDRLLKYDGKRRLDRRAVFPREHRAARATALLEARDGALWIGTRDDGLFRYGEQGFESIPISHPMVRGLTEDHEGNLWVATAGGGLNRVQPRVVEIEGAPTGVPSRVVQSIAEDASGRLWGATQNGLLVRRTAGAWRPVALGTGRLEPVTCVAADPAGALWIGTRAYRLHRLHAGRLTTWGRREGLEPHTICDLLRTRSGDLWIVGEGPYSLQRLHAGALHSLPLPAAVRGLRPIVEDAAGTIWVGAERGVLLRSAGEAVVEQPGLTVPKRIRSLCATADGSLWIGYDEGGGLGRLKDGRFAAIGGAQGLEAFTVSQIIDLPSGWMWLGTDRGIFRVSRDRLRDVMEGRSPELRPVAVAAERAAFTVVTRTFESTRALRSRDGAVWFPMGTALAVAYPDRLAEDAGPPPVLLKRVAVDGRTRAARGGIVPLPGGAVVDLRRPRGALRIEPGAHRLEIEFAAPSYRSPESLRLRFRLDGVDDGWVDAGSRRSATYPLLPAGRYRFRITTAAEGGAWDEHGAALELIVAPHPWQSWWFRLGAFAAFTAALVVAVRSVSFRRLRMSLRMLEWQERLHRERARIARDIHDDVGNRLTTITLLGGLAQRDIGDRQRTAGHVREIVAAARQVTDALDEIVWAVNPGNDAVPHVVSYLGQFALDLARTAGLRIRLELPERPPPLLISAEVRHGLFLAVKEALNNVVRHAQAGQVRLSLRVSGRRLDVAVEDDGRGFAADAGAAPGDGLANIRHRIQELGGRVEIDSAPGRGTRVVLQVPISAADGA